jgi:beta-galactosidase
VAGTAVVGPAVPLFLGRLAAQDLRTDVWSRYWIGTSYYPEQWPSEQWEQDFAKMAELGVNTVRMAEFAWSAIQPAPDRFDFSWLDEALLLAKRHGVSVILGTPTASIPPWLYRLHPDALGGNEAGPYTYGGRKGFSVHSHAMRDAADAVISRMAARYGNHPGVVGWQISNEPGYPMVDFDHNALLAFRGWLKQRYGTIARLNSIWSGTFWSNEYDDWDEIFFPINSAEGGWNPGIRLDYRRFFSDSFLEWLRFETGIVRQHSRGQFIYTNWPDTRWSVDIRQTASFLDAAAWDNYSRMPGTADVHEVLHSGLDHDLCRSSRADQRFFVAEQPSQTYADASTETVRLATYLDLAHGASGTVYFEWRAPEIGSERGYVSMLEADGSFGRSADQFRRLKVEMAKLNPLLANAHTVADVALIYSYTNQWEQGSRWTDKQKPGLTYDALAERYYTGAASLRRNLDVIPGTGDLRKYRLIVAPGLALVSDAQAETLRRFVHDGGILVLGHQAGTFDQDGRLRPLMEPGVFRQMAGIRVPSSLDPKHRLRQCTVSFFGSSRMYSVDQSIVLVTLEGATVLAKFGGKGVDGFPAATSHSYGKGNVVFVAAGTSDVGFFDALFGALAHKFSIAPLLAAPAGVIVTSRQNDRRQYLFLLNTNENAVMLRLPAQSREIISNRQVQGQFKLEGLEVAILEISSKSVA